MGRKAANQLSIQALPNGHFCLSGYFDGNRIRKRSERLEELQALKQKLEGNLAQVKAGPVLRSTWMSAEQVKTAEAITLMAVEGGFDLIEVVTAARGKKRIKPIKWAGAIDIWCQFLLNELKRYPQTVKKNKNRLLAFRRTVAGEFVHETTQEEFERHVLRAGVTPLTQLTDGGVVRAFFNFATRPTKRWCDHSPVSEEIMQDLANRANSTKRPLIFTPEQCKALLAAAQAEEGKQHVPYVVLATWCFLRHAEVLRVKLEDMSLSVEKPNLVVDPRKRGTPSYRVVTIPENAREMLAQCVAEGLLEKGKPLYFERRKFEQLRVEAGIDRRAKADARGYRKVISTGWQENILRHTGISYLYQKNGDIKEVCRQAGNSSDTAFKHYLQLPEPDAEKKFYAIGL